METGDLFASLSGHAEKKTIVRCKVTGTGKELEKAIRAADRKVEAAVKRIIRGLDGNKWEDPEFGPTEDDEFGAKSIYRAGKVRQGAGNACPTVHAAHAAASAPPPPAPHAVVTQPA